MKQKKRTSLLVALAALGLTACNFTGGGASSTYSGGGEKSTSSSEKSAEGLVIDQKTWNGWMGGNAIYLKQGTINVSGPNFYSYQFTGKKIRYSGSTNTRYLALDKVPTSISEVVSVDRYDYVERGNWSGYEKNTEEMSLLSFLETTELPQIDFDFSKFTKTYAEKDSFAVYEAENIAIKMGEKSVTGTVRASFDASYKGTPWLREIILILGEREFTLRFDDQNVPEINLPSDYRVYEEFSFELSEDGENYTLVGTMLEDHFLRVPSTHEGKPVSAVTPEFFSTTNAIVVILPASITTLIGDGYLSTHVLEVVAPSLDPYLFEGKAVSLVKSEAECHYRIDEDGFIVCDSKGEVHGYVGSETIVTYPEGYTTLPDLGCRGMEHVTQLIVPEGYTTLGSSPFYHLGGNQKVSVSLPNSLSTYASGNSFYCPNGMEFNVKDGLRYLGNDKNPYVFCFDDEYSSDYFKENTVFKVAEGCRVIAPYISFYQDVTITEIYIPDSVVGLPDGALSYVLMPTVTKIYIGGCDNGIRFYDPAKVANVTEVTFGPNAKGETSLYNLTALETLTINGPIQVMAQNLGQLTTIHLGEYCTGVPSEAFKGDIYVTELIIDNPAIDIGWGALTDLDFTTKQVDGVSYLPVGDNDKAILYHVDSDPQGIFSVDAGVKTIAAHAFIDATHVTKVMLPEGLLTVSDHAFANLHNINSISLPKSLLHIGNYAFYCTRITEATLPEGLLSIGFYAFYETEIESLTIPAGIEKIANNAFAYCSQLKSLTINCGSEPFGNYVFYCSGITSVTFNKPFQKIPEGMFAYNYALVVSEFPEGLETIGEDAFNEATLAATSFPEGLKSIGENNFVHFPSDKVLIPSTLVEIDPRAFVTGSFRVAEGNPVYSADDAGSLLSKDRHTLYRLSGSLTGAYTLAEGIDTVEEWAIHQSGISSFTATADLKTMASDCITSNDMLRSVDLSAATMRILPFDGITHNNVLCNFAFPQGVEILSTFSLMDNAFRELVIPETVKSIEWGCFSENPFYRVVLPAGLEEIDGAFANMYSKFEIVYGGDVSFDYPDGCVIVNSIGESKYHATEDGFVVYTDDDGLVHLVDYIGTAETVTLPDYITALDNNAFARADGVAKIEVPLTVLKADRSFMNGFFGQVEVHYAGDIYQWEKLFEGGYGPYDERGVHYTLEEHVHTWSEWEVTEEPVCGDHDGEKTRSCDVCGATDTETIEKHAEHSYGEWEIVTPCSAELASKDPDFDGDPSKDNGYGKFGGSRKKTCEYCGDVQEARVGSAYATSRQNMLSGTKKARSSETLPDPQYNRVKTYYRQSATSQEGSPSTIDNPLSNPSVKQVVFYDADWETYWDKSNMYGGEGYSYLDSDCLVGGYWNLDQPSGSRDTFFYEARFEVDNGNGRICLIVDTWGYIWKIVCYKTIIGSYPETMSWSLRMEWSKVEA